MTEIPHDIKLMSNEKLAREWDTAMFFDMQVGLSPEQQVRFAAIEDEIDRRSAAGAWFPIKADDCDPRLDIDDDTYLFGPGGTPGDPQ